MSAPVDEKLRGDCLAAASITAAAIKHLESVLDMSDSRIICEFPLGDVRVDILVVTADRLMAIEVKGRGDNFGERWKRQCQWYWYFTGDVTLIYAETLETQARKATQPGVANAQWALSVVAKDKDGEVKLGNWPNMGRCLRIPELDPRWRLSEMWRRECVGLALHHGLRFPAGAKKREITDLLIDSLPAPLIHAGFIYALKTRRYTAAQRNGYISPPLKETRGAAQKGLFMDGK